MVRLAALLTVAVPLALYFAFGDRLPRFSDWGDVAFLALLALPAVFTLVWLSLPARDDVPTRVLGAAAIALAVIAAVLHAAELDVLANFAKLAAATALGWWFLTFFEAAWWVLIVALLIVPVDLVSVARGPTKHITEEEPQVFDALSVFFRIPGDPSTAKLGLPDVLFFALFVGAAVRFDLRPLATWILATLSFGGTIVLAIWFDQAGVAALPLLSAAFVVANGDLLWRSIRRRRRYEEPAEDEER